MDGILTEIRESDKYASFRGKWRLKLVSKNDRNAVFFLTPAQNTALSPKMMRIELLAYISEMNDADEEIKQEKIEYQCYLACQVMEQMQQSESFRNIVSYEPIEKEQFCKVFGSDAKDVKYCLVSLCDQLVTVKEQVENNQFHDSELDMLQTAFDLCIAIQSFHRAGMVHGYIVPDNIYVQQSHKCILGRRMLYCDTEQIPFPMCDEILDEQTDIYMLGRCLAYIINKGNIEKGVVSSEGKSVNTVITKACEPDKQNRYKTIDEMIADLNRLRKKERKALPWIIAGLITLLAAAVFILLVIFSDSEPKNDGTMNNYPTEQENTSGTEKRFSIGDVDGSGTVNAMDASELLSISARMGSQHNELTAEEIKVYDVNSDGDVNAVDASLVLAYSARSGAGSEQSLSEFIEQHMK